MPETDIKTKIHKVVDQLPDSISSDVLSYLQELLDKTSEDLKMATNLSKILTEDKELLNRLSKRSIFSSTRDTA